MNFILQWIDLIWLPLGWFAAHKGQRPCVLTYVFLCVLMLRLLAETVIGMGYPNGAFGYLKMPVLERGLIVYSVFNMIYLMVAHYSNRRDIWLLFGGTMTIFIVASVFCLAIMLL